MKKFVMKNVLCIVLVAAVLSNCGAFLIKGISADSNYAKTSASTKVILTAQNANDSSRFYNTYWIQRSYTGFPFFLKLNADGTYSSASMSREFDSGSWNYQNGVLSLGGTNFTPSDTGSNSYFADFGDGTGISLSPDSGKTFDSIDPIEVRIGKTAVTWQDAKPFIDQNGRTMVPLRAVADALGINVDWDGKRQTATFTGTADYIVGPDMGYCPCHVSIAFKIGSNSATVTYTDDLGYNDDFFQRIPTGLTAKKTVQMDTVPVIQGDRTYAPIRYLVEELGGYVEWDGLYRVIKISDVNDDWSLAVNPFDS